MPYKSFLLTDFILIIMYKDTNFNINEFYNDEILKLNDHIFGIIVAPAFTLQIKILFIFLFNNDGQFKLEFRGMVCNPSFALLSLLSRAG